MKYALTSAAIVAALAFQHTAAGAVTIDYSGAGTVNYEDVSQSYGDTAEADVSYRSLNGGNNWGQTATELAGHVEYWNDANYSNDQAIFAVSNGNKLEVNLNAASGLQFTTISFQLGSYPNVDRLIDYRIYDANWNLLSSAASVLVSGAAGLSISLLALNTTAIHFQLGDDWDVGVNSISYRTTNGVNAVPVPGALLFLGSGLIGLAGIGMRRKRA